LQEFNVNNSVAPTDNALFFVLNVWEEQRDSRTEWRGEILHVESGKQIRFEDWPELVELIAQGLCTVDGEVDSHGAGGPAKENTHA
jgi:hypothetical protein